jgi:hypothetical protein
VAVFVRGEHRELEPIDLQAELDVVGVDTRKALGDVLGQLPRRLRPSGARHEAITGSLTGQQCGDVLGTGDVLIAARHDETHCVDA